MGVNKVILLGRLGKDPELRYTASQTPVASFSLATGERRKDQSGEWVEHTEWHNVTVFGRQAENCSNFLKKGREIYLEGRIQTRKWQDKEGRDRWTTEIVANNVQFVGGRGEGASYSDGPAPTGDAMSGLVSADSMSSGGPSEISFDDDDIPF